MQKEILGVFARQPVPGQVKTRLQSVYSPEFTARLYEAFLLDTLDKVRTVKLPVSRMIGYVQSLKAIEYFNSIAADFTLWEQPEKSLGERMHNWFKQGFETGASKMVLIGTDSPDLPVEYLEQAFQHLENSECVIGPATDGGYYLIGLNRHIPELFTDVPWSTNLVLTKTLEKCLQLKINYSLLPAWNDIDEPTDVNQLRIKLSEQFQLNEMKANFPVRTWSVLKTQ